MPRLSFADKELTELFRNLKHYESQLLDAGAEGLKNYGDGIMFQSLQQVPIDTMALHDSAFSGIPERVRVSETTVRIGYGGDYTKWNPKSEQPSSDYMVQVHEDLQMSHLTGKAKFLEDPVMEASPRLGVALVKHIQGKNIRLRVRGVR